ncbi:hypothetical protein KI387_038878 [Taxus chinensis]|uniref:Disease resistance R13L4/SHOC-2-like LRR domain-containing protein n=1 Tax=Taxus chinensis TaxID=29808 RepID=A0AA38C7N0_TAXCH|nr:hypothetical protein KI387_038878 [Taxus chinensis]
MLKTLTIKDCNKLCGLPKDFGRLSSLEKMAVEDCPSIKELPQGFGALPALKILTLKNCSALVKLVAGFGELACLEELHVLFCCNLETLPHDFENLASLREVRFYLCSMLEARALDKILKLKRCYHVFFLGSEELEKRWDEIQQEEEEYPILVDHHWFSRDKERAESVAVFHGQRIELNESRDELIEHKSIQLDKEISTVIVIHFALDFSKQELLQRVVGMAMERTKAASSGQLRILYVRKIILAERAMDEREERENMTQILKWLPQGSLAIPSTDTKRLLLIQHLFFDSSADEELACFMADVGVDDEGLPTSGYRKIIKESNISADTSGSKDAVSLEEYYRWSEGSVSSEENETSSQGNEEEIENCIELMINWEEEERGGTAMSVGNMHVMHI